MKRPTRAFQKNRALIVKQWHEVLNVTIPNLQSPSQAEYYEGELFKARQGGLISDAEYLKYLHMLQDTCKKNGWAMP